MNSRKRSSVAKVTNADGDVSYQRSAAVVPRQLFTEVVLRDKGCCRYCGRKADPLEIDHVWPRSLGGKEMLANLVVACKRCNRKKSDSTDWVPYSMDQQKSRIRRALERERNAQWRKKKKKQGDWVAVTELRKSEPVLTRGQRLAAEREASGGTWHQRPDFDASARRPPIYLAPPSKAREQ